MATEQGVVERLRAELNYDGSDHWESGAYLNDDIRALLAVVEAAQELDRWASRMPDAGFTDQSPRWKWWHERPRMDDKLAALHAQASDEGN